MAKSEVILETIKKMYDSGIELEVIKNTLKSIGLSDAEIAPYLDGLTGKKEEGQRGSPEIMGPEEEPEESEDIEAEKIASRTAEKVKAQIARKMDADDLRETTAHAALIEHQEKLGEVHKSVYDLQNKLSELSTPSNDALLAEIKNLTQRVATFDRELADIKAMTSATKSLMEKILDINRQILTESKK